jgi:uncharacterized protein
MTSAETIDVQTPVAVVITQRIAAENDAAYSAWQDKVGASVARQPGFVSRDVLPPSPPQQDAWVVVHHFAHLRDAQAWLSSDERRALMSEASGLTLGHDEVRIVAENPSSTPAASAMISHRVLPGNEERFLAWQSEISGAEARFPGFLGHRIERPIPGVQDDWVVVVTFDSPESLEKWVASPQREQLLERGSGIASEMRLERTRHGFGFWARDDQTDPVFKSNLIVLMMLYPVVFLWGYFVADPLFASHDVPFWLSLFIGNVVSTQLLGWFLVPWAFRRLSWWVKRHRRWQVHLAGYLIVCAVYAVSMALYAWLLSLR